MREFQLDQKKVKRAIIRIKVGKEWDEVAEELDKPPECAHYLLMVAGGRLKASPGLRRKLNLKERRKTVTMEKVNPRKLRRKQKEGVEIAVK